MVTYPKDWDDLTLGDLGSIKMCRRIFSHQTEKSGQIPFYKIGTFGKKADAYISRDLYDTYRSLYSFPRKGDVLISAAGTIGRTVVFDGNDAYFQDSNIVWLDTSDDEVDSAFLKYFYESYPWQNLEGTTIRRLYNSLILSTPISLPPLPEQKTIAETLSCMDEHIDNLTELIEKKKGIRDGALEDLVNGRTRLDGFNEKWKEHTFEDFMKIKRGASPRPIEYYITKNSSGVNWIKIGDAPKYGKNIIATKERITETGAFRSVRVYPGDFLLSNSMSFGRPYILNIEGCIHDGWLRLFNFQDTANAEYLYYLLSSDYVQRQYQCYAAGSGVQNLNKEVVKRVVVNLPSLPEQRAIAEILNSLDAEIASLEEEKDKMMQIKAGAMDDLLTGRIRLTRQGG